jgi:Porin subfamily
MKLVKSLLLGTAAGLAATVGAQAADLPSKKAAPVDYVKVCSAYGAGFFFIPGTDTCLRVGGRVRAEYLYGERFSGGDDVYGFRTRGVIRLDARNQTPYGTLRTFISLEATNSSGAFNRGVNSTGPNFVPGTGLTGVNGGPAAVAMNLTSTFIQFGPITAGRAASFFDFYADALNFGPVRGSDQTVNLLAYTATLGGGLSATIALEDGLQRQQFAGPAGAGSGGHEYPDIVANIALAQSWGTVQISGALSQVTSVGFRDAFGARVDDKVGFAVQGGLKLNLPMLAAGDVLWLQAAYAEGPIGYLGYGGIGQGSTWGANSTVGEVNVVNTDRTVTGLGTAKLTKGWAFTAAFLHYWTPTVRQAVFGSYSRLDYSAVAESAIIAGTVNTRATGSTVDSDEFRIGSNLIWSPVAGLDIGLEVLYARVDPKGRIFSSKAAGYGAVQNAANSARFSKGSDDAWQGRLRIQRDF